MDVVLGDLHVKLSGDFEERVESFHRIDLRLRPADEDDLLDVAPLQQMTQ